jgi:hypothetical protein
MRRFLRQRTASVRLALSLNIPACGWVTMKPPKHIHSGQRHQPARPWSCPTVASVSAAASMAPTMTMAEMALVDRHQVACAARGCTVQTTW